MKKLISILGSTTLIATSGISIVACQTNNDKNSQDDQFYQLPAKRPETLDDVKEIIGYYYDLKNFYKEEYYTNESPREIEPIDSENWQKMEVSNFANDAMSHYIFAYLGYEGDFELQTPNGDTYKGHTITEENLRLNYELYLENINLTKKTKEWTTNWYNWILTPEK